MLLPEQCLPTFIWPTWAMGLPDAPPSVAGKTFPAFPAHAQPAILRIWLEAHGVSSPTCVRSSWPLCNEMLAPNIWATNPRSLNFQPMTVQFSNENCAIIGWKACDIVMTLQCSGQVFWFSCWCGKVYNLVDMQSTKTRLKNGNEWNSNGSFVVKTWIWLQYHAISVLSSLHYLKWHLI